ncbi:unnamed protein product [Trichobilharzia szidati]|nr:unnamed protein product [Trichobilharzia szidati]
MVNFEVLGSFWLIIAVFATTNALDCNSFKQEWMKLRYTMLTGVHSSTINGPTSNICPVTGTSCCDINMEREMYTVGQRQLIKQCNSWLQVARKMSNDSASLELTFQMDLQQAKGRLHQFFSRIYGYNYKLHRNFFFGFFTDLEQYMAGQRGQLGLLIKNFFSQLRDSIVSLIERSGQVTSNPSFGNSGSVSSSAGSLGNNVPGVGGTDEASESRRIRCLSDKVAQLRPFDDVDVRLHARMLEAYPPARMLVNVLSVTSKLLYQLVDQVVTQSQCVLGITRYRFCALCNAQSPSNVCPDSCPQLLASCLHGDGPNEAQLAYIWPQLIDAIIMATNRLERSFNFPAVNRNLQMEISEAITSLQTRYSETKSKFESECRFGSSGRRMPTLFNPIGSHSQDNRVNHSDISRWPMMSDSSRQLNRMARSPSLSSSYSQSSSPVSQEFLAWQTRQQMPQMMPSNNHNPPKMDYAQSMNHRDWDTSDKGNSMNTPHDLVRQAGEIKQTYLSLRNLFSGPVGGDLCPNNNNLTTSSDVNLANSKTAANNSTGDCWNPPSLPITPPDPGITQILAQLYEASKRLHDASSNTKDPDTLVVQPIPRSNSNAYSRSGQNNPLNDPLSSNQYIAQDQWQGPSQSRMHNSYETGGNFGIESGSGNQPNTLQYPGEPLTQNFEQSSNQFNNMFPGDPHSNNDPRLYNSALDRDNKKTNVASNRYSNQKPTQQWPEKPSTAYSNSNNWDNTGIGRNNWESSGSTDLNIPIFQELTTQSEIITTSVTVPQTTTVATTLSVVTPTTVSQSTTTRPASTLTPAHEARGISTTETNNFVTETVTVHTPAVVSTTSTLDKRPSSTVYNTEATLKSSTFTDSLLSSTDRSNKFGYLPDDEDNTQVAYQTPNPQNTNSWHQPDRIPQAPFQEGSGEQGSGDTSVYVPQYQGTKPLWPSSDRQSVNQNAAGFGYNEDTDYLSPQPDKNLPFYQSTHKPVENQRNSGSWNVPPDKLASGFVEQASGVNPNAEWNEDKNDLSTGSSQWQDTLEGSGRNNQELVPNPIPEDLSRLQPPIQTTVPPIPSRVENVPGILPHPPLPPPEVWVPAKLSPGQPASPILLIREYSVEGPLYGKEDITSHPYNSASIQSLLFTSILLPLITLFFF